MPRRHPPPRRRVAGARNELTSARIEEGADGYDYHVRTIAAPRAAKTYRCPGCDHPVGPGVGHVVTWRADSGETAGDDRRHWHTPCWANRRSPTRKWS